MTAMKNLKKLTFRVHAIKRMFERHIDESDVRHALETGEVIEKYDDDTPYPSALVLGWRNGRPLHVVVADNPEDREIIVITVYEPGPDQWSKDFKRRKL